MVQMKSFASPAAQEREILRYAGCKKGEPGVEGLMRECLQEALPLLQYRVCWEKLPCRIAEGECDFGAFSVASRDLARNLQGCGEVILFAATVGMEMDRLIRKYRLLSPARAAMLQAIGAERVESLCDAFCASLTCDGMNIRPRFSPGYGDVDLSVQRDVFRVLQPEKNLGIYLNDSLLMSPSKTVTAFVGMEE